MVAESWPKGKQVLVIIDNIDVDQYDYKSTKNIYIHDLSLIWV